MCFKFYVERVSRFNESLWFNRRMSKSFKKRQQKCRSKSLEQSDERLNQAIKICHHLKKTNRKIENQ